MNKNFDITLFDCFGVFGRMVVKGIVATNKPNQYKAKMGRGKRQPSLMFYDQKTGSLKFCATVTVKTWWKELDFPYDTIRFPARISKWKYGYCGVPVFHFIVSSYGIRALSISSNDLFQNKPVLLKNKFMKEEFFYLVSKDKVRYFDVPQKVQRQALKKRGETEEEILASYGY